jgi:propanol-preferring alcohol dehydrogenase
VKALQYRTIGSAPEVVEIDTPVPGPGQLRLKVTAAGVCHSDAFLMSLPAEAYTFGLPLTLGHEGVGMIDMVGEGVDGRHLGVEVAVYGPWGCGQCYACAQGHENWRIGNQGGAIVARRSQLGLPAQSRARTR